MKSDTIQDKFDTAVNEHGLFWAFFGYFQKDSKLFTEGGITLDFEDWRKIHQNSDSKTDTGTKARVFARKKMVKLAKTLDENKYIYSILPQKEDGRAKVVDNITKIICKS